MGLYRIMFSITLLLYCNRISQGQSNINEDYETKYGNDIIGSSGGEDVKFQKQKLTAKYDDNKKPIFKNCDSYKPHINEEEEKGFFVIRVKAEDNDARENGGTVTYKIVSQSNSEQLFSINSTTGDVRTLKRFNRDEPERQLSFDLTVQATDNGIPPLSDMCSFKITIDDINDNAPQLDAQDATERNVAEDLKPNSEVMRLIAYDIDSGENARLTYTFSSENEMDRDFLEYFRIDENTGVVYLKQSVQAKKDHTFKTTVTIRDNGIPPQSTQAKVKIEIVNSDKQPPRIISVSQNEALKLPENFNNYEQNLVEIEAESNTKDNELIFELLRGKTAQTNRDGSFTLTQSGTKAYIMLARSLDFETVEKYDLTVRVKNKDQMEATVIIPIEVLDVNDEIPNFQEFITGSISENDRPPVKAMKAQAHDKDGTAANNIVKYKLQSHQDLFEIDENTGDIFSKAAFDREVEAVYHVMVEAYDNSPSALKKNGDPNKQTQKFQITIEDRNDNPPQFTRSLYVCRISETADIGKLVCTVEAKDKDDASQITYSIIDGNLGEAFIIEKNIGDIKVKNKLDYEKIKDYNLTVRAFDGIYGDTANVTIQIDNVNDEKPVIKIIGRDDAIITIKEETIPPGCILNISGYDPDISDRNADQKIVFTVNDPASEYLIIEKISMNEVCLKITQPLDADMPFGIRTTKRPASRQIYVVAYDNNGVTTTTTVPQQSNLEIKIILEDVNDNPPFLNVTEIVWYENQEPNFITELSADDIDGPNNGAPFTFRFSPDASEDIRNKFDIRDERNLYALERFDREQQKYYIIPIEITDNGNPRQTGTDYLKVIIGDVNDNAAEDGKSQIFVYKYEGLQQDINIGRVFVEDLDDWDLPDKVFTQLDTFEYFFLSDNDRGMIVMKSDAPEGTYTLNYEVTEKSELIERHTVNAVVTVTVKGIPEEAVIKSGSIRVNGSSIEEFVEESMNGQSKKDILHQRIAKIVNTSATNVDIFTVLSSPNQPKLFDVRFSAHGSPYYAPEKLNNKITKNQEELEQLLGVEFVMISINECLNQSACAPGSSCSNQLHIHDEPAVVFTNRTSFVGIKAIVDAVCECTTKYAKECFNGGTITSNGCICPSDYEGPNCEKLSIGFNGGGWAMYESLDACNYTEILVNVAPRSSEGLIFYAGPLGYRHALVSKEFISLELKDETVLLKVDNGYGIKEASIRKELNDNNQHKIRITVTTGKIEMEIDDCKSSCTNLTEFSQESTKKNKVLNTYGPLQIGGLSTDFSTEEAKIIWQQEPLNKLGFDGCISNFSFNGFMYNLGQPSDEYQAWIDCNYGTVQAVTFGIDSNFLVAILVCIAVLFVLLLAVVVHRRQQDNLQEKDIDDTTENIINYEDEGGGECDTNYDLTVFRKNLEEKPVMKYGAPADISDISGFLDVKKDSCDKDPDNMPYDDVRHYAYEGDGNSTGSLSSLGSCTDDGDLDFNYLSSFGKRFSKLADMYDYDGSDSDTQNGGEEAWC